MLICISSYYNNSHYIENTSSSTFNTTIIMSSMQCRICSCIFPSQGSQCTTADGQHNFQVVTVVVHVQPEIKPSSPSVASHIKPVSVPRGDEVKNEDTIYCHSKD